MSSTNWCFTVNNFSVEEYDTIVSTECVYLVVGKEVGSVAGVPHLQGFIVMDGRRSLKQMKSVNARAHWEIAKGTADQNATYCQKEGHWYEKGVRPASHKKRAAEGGQANKERWEVAKAAALTGDLASIDSQILICHYSSLKRMRMDFRPTPKDLDGFLQGIWYCGLAGCGKSSRARSENPGAFVKNLSLWWDGYNDEDTVLIEDMDPFHKAFARDFKIWSDRYVFTAEIKGGSMKIRPKKIVVTSQYMIENVWEDAETRAAIKRRFTVVNMFPEVN